MLGLSNRAFSHLPDGSWMISGHISDVRSTTGNMSVTNLFSVSGYYDHRRFLVETIPTHAEDEIQENAGWDLELFRLIQRFPKLPRKGLPRDQSGGIVEPSLFSQRATPALAGLLLALADTNALAYLQSGREPIIMGGQRSYPEERNTFIVEFTAPEAVKIQALTPGFQVTSRGEDPLKGFEKGFTRWTFSSRYTALPETNGFAVLFEYERFFPNVGKLVRFRRATGNLLLTPGTQIPADFKPPVLEPRLEVTDASGRVELFPWTKGVADSTFRYILTNRAWDFDQKIVAAHVAEVKNAFAVKPELQREIARATQPVNVPSYKKRQVFVIILVIILVAFPAFAWFSSRPTGRHKQVGKD
ncbi:MAG TPA: hypothetical protein VGF13_00400 [Verrucomicrobiae bacterium]